VEKIIFFILCCFLPKPVLAAETGFSVSPPFQEVVINRNDSYKESEIEIKNNTDSSVVFNISPVDFGSLDNSGGIVFLGSSESGERKYSLASWIQIDRNKLILDAHSSQKIKVSIINKDSLSPGGHYGAILVTLDSDLTQGNNVGIKQSYASLFFVKKTGGEIYSLKINKIDFKHNFLRINKKIKLNFQNDGNVHLVPRGTISVMDPFNRLVLRQSINIDSSIIIPESFRDFNVTLDKVSSLIWPGKYRLFIDYRFDGQDEVKNQQINFVFVPFFWLLFLPVFVGFFYVRKHWKT
jgi:hypothetical protein